MEGCLDSVKGVSPSSMVGYQKGSRLAIVWISKGTKTIKLSLVEGVSWHNLIRFERRGMHSSKEHGACSQIRRQELFAPYLRHIIHPEPPLLSMRFFRFACPDLIPPEKSFPPNFASSSSFQDLPRPFL